MLSCAVCETPKNTYFEEYLQRTASGGVLSKRPFLKTLQYSQDERRQWQSFCEKAVLGDW